MLWASASRCECTRAASALCLGPLAQVKEQAASALCPGQSDSRLLLHRQLPAPLYWSLPLPMSLACR